MIPPADQCNPLGTHLVHVDGDTLVVIVRGVITIDDMRVLLDYFQRIRGEHGLLFSLYDARQFTGIDPAARKLASDERSRNMDADLRVAFGIPFSTRVMLNMITRARKLLNNQEVTGRFFDKEMEAWAFFEKERDRIRREFNSKKSL